jgi:hypothetical protein
MARQNNQWNNLILKYPFDGSDQLNASYSQVWQDIFVLSILKGKSNGTYLEIGAENPDYINNTYLLTTQLGWNGVSIDCVENYQKSWAEQRPDNKFILCDALSVDYKQILDENYNGQKVIDFLQCDIEPSVNTFTALKRIPHDEYRFRIITFETDLYTGGQSPWVREESRKYLSGLGYEMIVGDVLVDGNNPYEDWWVAPELVNMEIANSIRAEALTTQHPAHLLFK